jgi:hypothetical protein
MDLAQCVRGARRERMLEEEDDGNRRALVVKLLLHFAIQNAVLFYFGLSIYSMDCYVTKVLVWHWRHRSTTVG